MENLASRSCLPCTGDVRPLRGDTLTPYRRALSDWTVAEEHHLERTFRFPDFAAALDFTNRIGAIAEAESHHPDILLGWGKVTVRIWTHTADGLTENDFILAAKIEREAP